MAQINKERLRRSIASDSSNAFKKQVKQFREVLDREKRAHGLGSARTCSRFKQALVEDLLRFASEEGISRGEAEKTAMKIACMPEEKLGALKGATLLGFRGFQETLISLLDSGDAYLAEREEELENTLGKIENLRVELLGTSAKSKDAFCEWSQDHALHAEMINLSAESCMDIAKGLWANPAIATEGFVKATECWIEALRIYAEVQKITAHSYIATQCLGLEVPGYVRAQLERGLLEPTLEQLSPEKYEDCIWRMSFVPPEEIAKELLRMLFPGRWKKLLAECMVEETAVAPQEKPSLPPRHLELAKRLLKGYPEDRFTEVFVGNLGEECGWDEGKAVSVVELGYYGIGREDALFLLNEGLDENIAGKHTLVASILEGEGVSHREVHYAFRVLDEDACWEMVENLSGYLGWMEVMPGKWDEDEKQELSAVLALAARPPASRAGVHAVLREKADGIIDRMIELESENDRIEKNFFEYFRYTRSFVRERAAAGKEIEVEVERAPVRRVERPHESLEFSPEVEQHIESKGIMVENVKRAIVYGLRLSSRKSAIGGKYFPVTAFRRNVSVVLSREAGNPEERRKVIEEFLFKEGVISYYKQGDVVKLNLKDEIGQHNGPSEIGQQILDSVVGWKVEFDRRTKGNGS